MIWKGNKNQEHEKTLANHNILFRRNDVINFIEGVVPWILRVKEKLLKN